MEPITKNNGTEETVKDQVVTTTDATTPTKPTTKRPVGRPRKTSRKQPKKTATATKKKAPTKPKVTLDNLSTTKPKTSPKVKDAIVGIPFTPINKLPSDMTDAELEQTLKQLDTDKQLVQLAKSEEAVKEEIYLRKYQHVEQRYKDMLEFERLSLSFKDLFETELVASLHIKAKNEAGELIEQTITIDFSSKSMATNDTDSRKNRDNLIAIAKFRSLAERKFAEQLLASTMPETHQVVTVKRNRGEL